MRCEKERRIALCDEQRAQDSKPDGDGVMNSISVKELRSDNLARVPANFCQSARPVRPYNSVTSIGRILVTGGTGFIGGAVLAELLEGPHWPNVLMMVRAGSVEEGRQRIIESVARFIGHSRCAAQIKSANIVVAGLETCDSLADDARISQVTHVIHSAAVTSFSNHPRIDAVNVDGSLKFVSMLDRCADVRRFVNVGTAWSVGMNSGRSIKEDGSQETDEHVVPYTKSKREFERRLRSELPWFPIVSARPSIVVGHTKLGTAPSGSIYWVFRAAQMLGQFTCSFRERVDVVPVDWVAKALVHLTLKPDLWFDTYHLSAGHGSYSTVAELERAIAGGRRVEPLAEAKYNRVTRQKLAEEIQSCALFGDANPALLSRALLIYSKFAESGVVFENDRAFAEGISQAPAFHTYAAYCAETAETTSIAAQMEDDFK